VAVDTIKELMWLRIERRVKLGYEDWVDVIQGEVLKEIGCRNMAGFMWRWARCRKICGI
jgi:hypothetical protein